MSVPPITLTINGKSVTVPAGTSVFQAAESIGEMIPHYCYHPDLSIAGVCRMCMVEIEKLPRLQISCNTKAAEGMVIRTDTAKVKESVKGTLELHLINHPLDCPICDKAGECKLQDYYSDYGLYQSRVEMEGKVHKPKVVDIGTIVLDSERCILCTRCVRFTAEVTNSHELGIFNRGDRSELRTYDKGPLRNEYTGNLADICPVGALTAKDFRFQQRVWFLDKVKSVCTLCAHGCNTDVSISPATKKLYRVEPRRNVDVNKSWICDEGRWGYHHVHDERRVQVPQRKIDGKFVEATWHETFKYLNDRLLEQKVPTLIALSTQLTNEELIDCFLTFREFPNITFTWVVDETAATDRKPYDGILRHRDKNANTLGFEWIATRLGVDWMKHDRLSTKSFDIVLCLGLEGHAPSGVVSLFGKVSKGTEIFCHTTSHSPYFELAKWQLPNVSSFEKSGTVFSAAGRLQKVNAALPKQFTARDAMGVVWGIRQGNDKQAVPNARSEDLFHQVLVANLFSEVKE